MLTKSDIQQIGDVVDQKLNKRLDPIEKGIKSLKKDMRYLTKTVDIIAKNYDLEDAKLKVRVSKIEHHLGLPTKN